MSIDFNGSPEKLTNKAQLKAENIRNLSSFSSYWINPTSLQEVMIKLWQDLWDFWPKWNWVDGDLWSASINSLKNIQGKLDLPVTGVVNIPLLIYLFPHVFEWRNIKNWRSIQDTITFVKEKVTWEKTEIKKSSLQERMALILDVKSKNKQHYSKPQDKFLKQVENIFDKDLNNSWIWKIVYSEPAEKRWKMTFCSRTARKNLYKLWLPVKDVPHWSSAIASMRLYWSKNNYVNKISNLPEWTNVLDLFIDSRSKYEHRAVAYLNNWEWNVLDPYSRLPSNKWNRKNPIPLNEYMASKKLMWAFPHIA